MFSVEFYSGDIIKEAFFSSQEEIQLIFGITECEFMNYYLYNSSSGSASSESILKSVNKINEKEAPRKKIEVVFQ